MTPQLVKKSRVKRARKWLVRKLVPSAWFACKVHRQWRRRDRDSLPCIEPGRELADYEYSLHSQNGEDGIIRYLFSEIGFESRHLVEFGFGAAQCNGLRLILTEGFSGLFMDGSAENCEYFNSAASRRGLERASAVCAFLDTGNLPKLIRDNAVPAEIDFLSIDVDGNDYWFWQALGFVSARVVCIEYNSGIGPEYSWTVPYDPAFQRFRKHPSGFFHGASLAALESLGKQLGYRLVGCDSTGTNAFFLRGDIDAPRIPTRTAAEAFRPHRNWLGRGFSEQEQIEIMKTMPYQEV